MSPSHSDRLYRMALVSQAFTPAAPVNNVSLFADRPDVVWSCIDAFYQRGLHIALYGERGVGKTSLANIVPLLLKGTKLSLHEAVRVDCNTQDTFNSIWRKVFRALDKPFEALQDVGPRAAAIDAEE